MQGEEVDMGISIFIIVILLLVFVVGANILGRNFQKRKIRRSAEKKGWKDLNISYHSLFGWDNPYGYQNYDVNFVDEQGQRRSARCQLRGPWSDVDWKS